MANRQRALITGAMGFVAKYLAEHLQACGIDVFGVDIGEHCPHPGISYIKTDILDREAVTKVLAQVRPRQVYHLAAVSFPPDADLSPHHALEINILGAVSLLDAVHGMSSPCTILLVGSSKEYNDSIVTDSIAEISIPQPHTFYGVSKYAAELIGLQYVARYDLDIRFTRSFNHTGPGQPNRFVCSDWSKQVVDIEHGIRPPAITVGDLNLTIDFTDVRDVVGAYEGIVTLGKKGEIYNVCSGKGTSLQYILSYLVSKSSKKISVRVDDSKLRAHKTNSRMIGDNSKLVAHTGWKPLFPIEKTLDDIYHYWQDKV